MKHEKLRGLTETRDDQSETFTWNLMVGTDMEDTVHAAVLQNFLTGYTVQFKFNDQFVIVNGTQTAHEILMDKSAWYRKCYLDNEKLESQTSTSRTTGS